MLNEADLAQRADQLLAQVRALPTAEALEVLNTATGRLLAGVRANRAQLVAPVANTSPLLCERSRGYPSKIEADDEVRQFVHSQPCNMPYSKIARLCRERFGPERAPSRHAIGRYVQRLKYPKKTNNGGDE